MDTLENLVEDEDFKKITNLKAFMVSYIMNTSCSCHPEYDEYYYATCKRSIEDVKKQIEEAHPETKISDWDIEELDITEESEDLLSLR